MTTPVRSVSPTTADARLLHAARDAGVAESDTPVYGKSAHATRKSQHSPSAGLRDLTKSVAAEAVSTVAAAGSGLGAGVVAVLAGPAYTTWCMFKAFYQAHEEATALRRANERDAVHLAFVWAGAGALPPSYVQSVSRELKAVGGERGGAMKILNGIMADPARWQATRDEANTHIGIGRKVAQKFCITSQDALDERLARDPRFAAAYRQNLGFFHGVQSVLFEANVTRARGDG